MKIHPHHDVITAYLEGKQIQYYSLGDWVDLDKISNNWGNFPSFNPNVEYREKPKPSVFYSKKAKQIGKELVVRDPEHWEKENVQFEFDGNTGALINVKVL